ncbi:T9SS type A sorting domain-containing protein [Chitinophaga qingshengii]|uniref:T9SS type A sorting domain-containing protein n=1 Tax=Chitinophaga qingshengii TaxID=1569794 RepID=A0ABR7TXR9_9BACT|nr:T9SS type A sorting domain-containing protein [Chitinophaga qingshengii]MBC9934241.1 T9SS type A sorting domain-containing protein [Chitinophaga qingshengii]
MKKTSTVLSGLLLAFASSYGQYTTTWMGNNFSDVNNHVGNCARSMWVSPQGVVYTAAMWDEKGRNIGIYQNGATLGSMGGNKESQGSAIGGDATYIFTAQQTPNGGKVGRYNRATKVRDLLFAASAGTTGDVIGGIAVSAGRVYVADSSGNRIVVFTTGGVQLRQWPVAGPGAVAIDSSGRLWVAQRYQGKVLSFDTTGVAGTTISLGASARPSALYADSIRGQLLIGDQGPDMQIKIYGNLTGTPVLSGTFGVQGGYLNQSSGIRGATGDKRFTRVAGISRDAAGNLYVLNNPWGGTWDLGRNGATDIHCYNNAGNLLWTLQALNFEGNASADAGSDGTYFYSGNIIYSYTGTDGGTYVANTVDPYRYPLDARIQMTDHARGEHFGHLANVGGHKILIACNQNADIFYTYYFNEATDGYIAIPNDTISKVRNGFCLDSIGDIWISQDKTDAIQHYPLTGFAANGKPIYGPVVSTPTPASIARLNRIEYVPASDMMVLAGGNTDWTLIGNRIEVYRGWKAGNRTPNLVITLSRAQAKSMSAAGNYLFVGYYAIPDIDVFDLSTGALVLTMNTSNPAVYVGNDVDSQYGIKAYHRSTGEYLITKDDYNANKVVLYRWTPATAPATSDSVTTATATLVSRNANAGFRIFPNPVDKTLYIDLKQTAAKGYTLDIFDFSGKTVKTMQANGQGQMQADVAGLMPGSYVLRIMDAASRKVLGQQKFIKL